MAYQTIRDLTDNVRRLHRHLRTLIDEARSREDDERSKLLLDFIDQHESALEQAVEVAERRQDGSVLDTWLQYEPNVKATTLSRLAGLRAYDPRMIRVAPEDPQKEPPPKKPPKVPEDVPPIDDPPRPKKPPVKDPPKPPRKPKNPSRESPPGDPNQS